LSEQTSQTSVEASRYKRRFRNYLIDKSLQLRYVVVVASISAALALVLGYLLNRQESRASETIIRSMKGAADFLGPDAMNEVISSLHAQDQSQAGIMLIVGVGLLVVLSGYLVIMTHKVAGPLYKIGIYFDRMRDGKLPKVYALRKGDQLRDFFEKFQQMDEALRERTEKEIALYERVLAQAEGAGLTGAGELGHKLDELKQLVKDKKLSLS
jgi:hypothetical protein